MKKLLSLLCVFCLILACVPALAADDPFEPGVSYGTPFRGEYGAVPSMLNFGSAGRMAPGQSFFDVKTTNIKKISGSALSRGLDNTTYYVFAKWQCAQAIPQYEIEGMLVMTDPSGNYYATYDSYSIFDTRAKTIFSWFFDVTDCLQRCKEENDGTFERGIYTFSLFLNDMAFRTVNVTIN